MQRLNLVTAAELVRDSYAGPQALPILRRKSAAAAGAEAYLTQGGILIIPGTNELGDWTDYNAKAFHAKGKDLGWEAHNPFIAAATWHFGFALHAIEVMDFLGGEVPRAIVGHSLGAASAQILGCHFQVPTVTFAAPRPLIGATALPGEGWVLNLVHSDDVIGLVLAQRAGFRRLGSVRWLTPGQSAGFSHAMAEYLPVLKKRLAEGTLAADWPPPPLP